MYLARAGHFANGCANPVDLREHLIVKTKPSELFSSGNFSSNHRETAARVSRNLNVTWISRLLAPFDAYAVDCSLQFFAANPYHVGGASFPRPAPTVVNFDPVTGQTTSGKRRYPNPMLTFLYGDRRAFVCEIKIQLCRLTWFDRRVVDGGLHGPIHHQCHSVVAYRKTF